MDAADKLLQALAHDPGHGPVEMERRDVVHPTLVGAARVPHRHHHHAIGYDLAACQNETRTRVDDLPREVEFSTVVAPTRTFLLQDGQCRLLEQGLSRQPDQLQPLGGKVGVGVDGGDGGERPGLLEEGSLAPTVRGLRARQHLTVAHIDQHTHGLKRAPVRRHDHLAAAHHRAQRSIRANDPEGLLDHVAGLKQLRRRGDAVPVLRMDEGEEQAVFRPG